MGQTDSYVSCGFGFHLELVAHALSDDGYYGFTVASCHAVARCSKAGLHVVAAFVEWVDRCRHAEICHQLLVCRTRVDRVETDVVCWNSGQKIRNTYSSLLIFLH